MNECVYFRHEVHRTTIKDRQRENVQTDINIQEHGTKAQVYILYAVLTVLVCESL